MTRRALVATPVFALLMLAACRDDGGSTVEPPLDTSSSTTAATSSTTAPDDTTTTTVVESALVLRGDGLGVVQLGADPETAIAAVSAELGAPSVDTGWESSFSSYGTCPGESIRGVEWDHLVLLFTDGDTAYGRGEHLFTWRLTGAPPALGTARGLGYRATVADAEELYPGDVEITEADDPFPGFVQVAAEGGIITGYLDGDVITNLEGGTGCGE